MVRLGQGLLRWTSYVLGFIGAAVVAGLITVAIFGSNGSTAVVATFLALWIILVGPFVLLVAFALALVFVEVRKLTRAMFGRTA